MPEVNISPTSKPYRATRVFGRIFNPNFKVLILGIILGFIIANLQTWRALVYRHGVDISAVKEAIITLKDKYDGDFDLNSKKLTESALKGIADSVGDPYTAYLDEEAVKALQSSLSGELIGVGVEVSLQDSKIIVVSPIPDGPADKAGIKSGDNVIAVNGESTEGKDLEEVTSKIRGEAGTKVTLTVISNNEKKDFEIIREKIIIASVKSTVKDGIGILTISRFGDDTALQTKLALEEYKKQGINKIVIDLRGNPGGYLDTAVEVTSQFQATGEVVEEKSKESREDKIFTAESGGLMTDAKIAVLIDKGSASASEIMAGSLQDNHRAILIGEKSFGKGLVQEILDFPSTGGKLKITVAHWYTPDGKTIDKTGITPDIIQQDDFSTPADEQLDKALSELIK